MGLGFALAVAGVLPASACCPAYDVVWGTLMPVASALLVVETRDMSRLRAHGSRLLVAFAVGAVGMFVGALVAAVVLGAEPAVSSCLLASWTGGSVNFIAAAQALQLPLGSMPVVMAADNAAMCVALAALMACPLRLVRRLTTTEKGEAARGTRSRSPPKSPARDAASPAGSASPSGGAGRGETDGGLVVASVQAALQRQVAVPARMSGKPLARDGGLLLTEEPAPATVWAAYQRSRGRAVYDGPAPADGSVGTGSSEWASNSGSNGNGGSKAPAAPHPASSGGGIGDGADPPSVLVAGLVELPTEDGPAAGVAPFERGPLARDGTPLLTAEPSPLSLQAAYARSRDDSRDSSVGGSGSDSEDAVAGGTRGSPALTAQSAVLSLAAAGVVCAAARALATATGTPHLFLLAVSVLALCASAAGGWKGRALFSGASLLGPPLMGMFFATIGATSTTAGASVAALAPLLGFLGLMAVVHWGLLLAGARLLQLEPSIVLVASNALVGGPATAAGMATSRGWGRLVQPAMVAGSLSYGIGSAAGLLLGLLLARLQGAA